MSGNVLLSAHRGYSGKYPENTMRAFREAIKLDIDQIETDVHMAADGNIVIIHDADPYRVTGVHGRIADMTLREIKALDAGAFKGAAFAGERIPLLEAFAELVKDTDLTFNIELKDYPSDVGEDRAKESADRTLAILDRYGILNRCMINSFSARILTYVHSVAPDRPLHTYYPEYINGDYDTAPCYPVSQWACVFHRYPQGYGGPRPEGPVAPKEWFDNVYALGMTPCVYFPQETEADLVRACGYGAKLVTSNTPAFAAEVLARHGYRTGRNG